MTDTDPAELKAQIALLEARLEEAQRMLERECLARQIAESRLAEFESAEPPNKD